jgi:hypothetical protein
MSSKGPASYADAIVEAQNLVRRGRLADPGEHFPYKHGVAVLGGLHPDVADACQAFIDAQQAYLEDPGDGTRSDYQAAQERLVLARRERRIAEGRPGSEVFTDNSQEG